MARKQYHHGNLKQAIIQESLKQLNLVGAEKLSFRAIAKNLEVVSSAPYNHFSSKKDLLNELINLGTKILLEKMNKEKIKDSSPAKKTAPKKKTASMKKSTPKKKTLTKKSVSKKTAKPKENK